MSAERGERGRWFHPIERALFRDRRDAGRQLAEALRGEARPGLLVLGIPRGGVPVAAEVARALGGELDLIVAKKLGAPGNPELAIGAVTAGGQQVLNEDLLADLGVGEAWIQRESARKSREACEREQLLRSSRPAPRVRGRSVILVDDGLATGATARVCARTLRAEQPARLVLAVPVGAAEACEQLAREVDALVCLERPEPFIAVGLHYAEFEPVSEERVRELLAPGAD